MFGPRKPDPGHEALNKAVDEEIKHIFGGDPTKLAEHHLQPTKGGHQSSVGHGQLGHGHNWDHHNFHHSGGHHFAGSQLGNTVSGVGFGGGSGLGEEFTVFNPNGIRSVGFGGDSKGHDGRSGKGHDASESKGYLGGFSRGYSSSGGGGGSESSGSSIVVTHGESKKDLVIMSDNGIVAQFADDRKK